MEILIFYIWVCNKKDIVFSVRIFLEFATLKLHIKLKKGHERQNKVHGIQKNNAKLDTFHEINETVI